MCWVYSKYNATLPTQYLGMGPIVKLEIAKMHRPLVLKRFRVLLKTVPKPLLWLSVKLDNIGRLETFKAAICVPHCHSSAVLMVILLTMCPGVVTILTTESLRGRHSDMGHFSGQLLDTHQVITMRQYSNSSKYLIDSSYLASTINNVSEWENSRVTRCSNSGELKYFCRPILKLFNWYPLRPH